MTRPWCSRRRRKRRRRSARRTLQWSTSSTTITCGGASGTQLASGIAGGWPLPMGHRPAIRYGGLRGSSAVGQGDRSSSSVPAGIQRQVPAVLGLEVPQIQFIDSGWTFLLCLLRRLPTVQTVQVDRRDSPVAVLGPGVDMPVIVQRHMHNSRLSRSSTSLSLRRGCPWS